MPVQIFLGDEIIDGVADPQQRTFERSNINQRASFSTQFYEAVPTMWAGAYELESLIETYVNPPVGVRPAEETYRAVEEWVCLFLLFYSGVANFEVARPDGGRLWSAMKGTYPKADELDEVALLLVDDEEVRTVVGATYPGVVFFPSRGRAAWSQNTALRDCLAGNRLSWDSCRQKLLRGPQDENEFAAFLSNVRATIGGGGSAAIAKFAQEKGLTLPGGGRAFNDRRPYRAGAAWTRAIEEDVEAIMAAYPFVKEVKDEHGRVTERVYFLVTGVTDVNGRRAEGLPDTGWMREQIRRGMPAPNAFYQKTDNNGNLLGQRVFIRWASREMEYALRDNPAAGEMREKAVLLKDCFMKESAWCQAPADDVFKVHADRCHKLTNDEQSPVLNKQAAGNSYHLAPVTEEFLKHFGRELYRNSENGLVKLAGIERRAEDTGADADRRPRLEWTFTFEVGERDDPERQRQLGVKWYGEVAQKEFNTVSAAIWPPKTHKDWRLYFSYGRGAGSWKLYDENGVPAERKLKGDDFLYTSGEREGTQERPNRPASLMFLDRAGNQRGVLFLQPLSDVGGPAGKANLGIDFGTSNTCVAYKLPGAGPAQVLKFTLAPEVVWGRTGAELPGFVPFRWHDKDFFSTVLLSDKFHDFEQVQVASLRPSDLFMTIDIPTLHQGLKENLALNKYKAEWHVKSDLKWQEPLIFRDLFLGLTLLYAHAELLFTHGYSIGRCVFTFPLAFNATRRGNFERQTTAVYQRIHQMCYGGPPPAAPEFLSESAAVAASQGTQNSFDLFIDIGGGSTDVALTHRTADGMFTALDSIEVAGKEFFEFIWEHFGGAQESNKQLRRDLSLLLSGKDQELAITTENQAYLGEIGGFGYFYSFLISERAAAQLEEAEQKVREGPREYYQHFRSQMFYEHILTYALIQACAAVTTHPSLPRFIRILCTGNGWGMLTLAKWNKTQAHLTSLANNILNSIKSALDARLTEDELKERVNRLEISEVLFLGQPSTGHGAQIKYTAKSAVACGAVDANVQMAAAGAQSDLDGNSASCYAGITLGNVRVGDERMGHVSVPVNWNDRWIFKKFSAPLQAVTGEIARTQINNFQFTVTNNGEPPDTLLKLFFNTFQLKDAWVTQKWHDLNAVTLDQQQYTAQNYQMPPSPLNRFLAEALYGNRRLVLRELAEKLGKS